MGAKMYQGIKTGLFYKFKMFFAAVLGKNPFHNVYLDHEPWNSLTCMILAA